MRIFLIDDDALVRTSIGAGLRAANCDVLDFDNATAALTQLSEDEKVDAIVTDIFMPGTDGLEFISRARRIAPETPIIAMSGGPVNLRGAALDVDMLRVAASFGATACIGKPFTTGQLVTLLRSALEDRQEGVQ